MFYQYLVNGVLTGSIAALVSIGFFVVYRTSRFFHFAHGISIAVGAYCAYSLARTFPDIRMVCLVLTILIMLGYGALTEYVVFRPLRKLGAGGGVLLVASMSMYTVIQNVISLVFGDDVLSLRWWPIEPGYAVLGTRITMVQIITVAGSWILSACVWISLKYSCIGRQMRAVANNSQLAYLSGINIERVYLWTMCMSSALAGVVGIFIACDVDMMPTMGMQPLMLGMVAVVVGGRTMAGVFCSALLLGFARHVGVIWIPTKWQDVIPLVVLLFVLVLKSYGFFGDYIRE